MLKHLINLSKIKNAVYTVVGSLDAYVKPSDEPLSYADAKKPEGYKRIAEGEVWARRFGCGWFRFKGVVPASAKGAHVVALIDVGGEGLAFNKDGIPRAAISKAECPTEKLTVSKREIEVTERAAGGEKIDFLTDAGFNGYNRSKNACAKLGQADVATVNDEVKRYLFDYETLFFALKADKDKTLDKALSESFAAADLENGDVKKSREILSKFFKEGEREYDLRVIGHSHLDLAWLWPVRESRRKIARTVRNELNNLSSSDYVFGMSQPQALVWLERDYPELFRELQRAFSEGRAEPIGAMWTESDCNLPSGESLARQFLYGQRYWIEKTGKPVDICWLPDTFGFPASFPQIAAQSGVKYFVTSKLWRNKHNRFPYESFYWEGIDGTRLLAHMPPEEYGSEATPLSAKKAVSNTRVSKLALMPAGVSDGGGGAGQPHIAHVERQRALKNYNMRFCRVGDFFRDLEREDLPTYKGELYLEKHQGTYTTAAKNKYFNRKLENLLHSAEALAVKYYLDGGVYPQKELERLWKSALFYQFHDILAGSSIGRVNEEARLHYDKLFSEARELRNNLLKKEKKALSVVNTASFSRKEWFAYDDKWYRVETEPYSAKKLEAGQKEEYGFFYDKNTMENNRVKILFNNDGSIRSYYDKINQREICGKYLNRFYIYNDKYLKYNAWDIDEKWNFAPKEQPPLKRMRVGVNGAMLVRTNIFTHRRTYIKQNIVLLWDEDSLRFDTKVGWHEKNQMLRADFQPSVWSDKIDCDIQFGTITRPTTENNPVEKAQFEICAHKYVDICGEGLSLALLNDCKYGLRAKNGHLSLNLLRATQYPDNKADTGEHVFSYALCPHRDKQSLLAAAYAFDNPLVVSEYEQSFEPILSCSKQTVVVETLKKAEDCDAVIARLCERAGEETEIYLSAGFRFKSAEFCDILERKTGKADISRLKFRPFEIKNIVFEVERG